MFQWVTDLWRFRTNANLIRSLEEKVGHKLASWPGVPTAIHPDPADDHQGDSAAPLPPMPDFSDEQFGMYEDGFRMAAYRKVAPLWPGTKLADITLVSADEHGKPEVILWQLCIPPDDPEAPEEPYRHGFDLREFADAMERGLSPSVVVKSHVAAFEAKLLATLNPKRQRNRF